MRLGCFPFGGALTVKLLLLRGYQMNNFHLNHLKINYKSFLRSGGGGGSVCILQFSHCTIEYLHSVTTYWIGWPIFEHATLILLPSKHVIRSHSLKHVLMSCWTKITLFALHGVYRLINPKKKKSLSSPHRLTNSYFLKDISNKRPNTDLHQALE